MKNITDITILCDRSGSTASIKSDLEGGIKNLIIENKKLKDPCNFSFITFDTEYDEIIKALDIQLVDESNIKINPRGGTALLDSIGRAINNMGKRFSDLSESERPSRCVLVICTDGQENSSREFTKPQISEMIKHQEQNYKWEIIYLGANQDSFAEAGAFGISNSKIMNYSATSNSINAAFNSVSSNLTLFRSAGKADMSYEVTDREAQEKLAAGKK